MGKRFAFQSEARGVKIDWVYISWEDVLQNPCDFKVRSLPRNLARSDGVVICFVVNLIKPDIKIVALLGIEDVLVLHIWSKLDRIRIISFWTEHWMNLVEVDLYIWNKFHNLFRGLARGLSGLPVWVKADVHLEVNCLLHYWNVISLQLDWLVGIQVQAVDGVSWKIFVH